MKRLAVYCGSATPENPIYINVAREVGKALAKRGIGVVYGGGRLGLMGAVADSALEAGGDVIGIIPEALVGAEVAHKGCTELHVVSGMHERKQRFTLSLYPAASAQWMNCGRPLAGRSLAITKNPLAC